MRRSRRSRSLTAVSAVVAGLSMSMLPVSPAAAAPSVSFTSPGPSRVLAGTQPVEVASSGDLVDLWADQAGGSVFVGRDDTAPFVFDLDTTAFADGPVVLRARAFDGTWAVRSRTVVVDNTAPSVVFAHPAPLTHHAGWMTVTASVADATTRFVDLYVAGTFHGRDWSAPYTFAVDTRALADGPLELRLRAHDRAGQVSVVSRTVTAANGAAAAAIVEPNPGRHVRGVVGVTTSVTGTAAPVAQTEFLVDGEVTATFAYLPRVISWDTAAAAEGPVSLQLRVTDKAGKTSTSPVRIVTVDRTAPTVAFTSPRPGATLAGTATVELAVTDTNVETVQLYANTTLVGAATQAPYVFTVDLSSATGPVVLRAVVVDKSKQRAVAGRVVNALALQRPYSVGSPTVARTGDTLTVSWSRPRFDIARPVAGYTIYRFTPGDLPAGPTTTDVTVTDLAATDLAAHVIGTADATATSFTDTTPAAGPVVYAVQAHNPAGVAHPVPVAYTPATAPGAPTITSVTPGDRTVTVAFTAPESDGGSPVTGYEYSTDDGTTWRATPSTASPTTITTISGVENTTLVNGTSYDIRLRAQNAVGVGAASAASTGTPVAPLELSYASTTFTTGQTAQVLSPSIAGGSGTVSYSFTGTLPPGVSFDTSTGTFTGPSTWSAVADGSLDATSTFNTGTGPAGVNGRIAAIQPQPDGKILVGGGFVGFNGANVNYLTRLNADGSLDETFNTGTGPNNWVTQIQLASDGKIVIVGWFTTYNGTSRNRIARLNADGSLDTSFNPGTGTTSSVRAMQIQPDNKILLGGEFASFNGSNGRGIVRLNTDGSVDGTFVRGTGTDQAVYTIDVQSDGKIVIGGNFNSYRGTNLQLRRIARLNADGSLDATFNPGSGADGGMVTSTVLLPNDKILISGSFSTYNGTARTRIALLNADGSLDTSFNPGTGINWSASAMIAVEEGKFLISGDFSSYNSTNRIGIARLNADGSLDTSFNPGGGFRDAGNNVGGSSELALQVDGKIIVAGNFATYNGQMRNRIARLGSTIAGWPASIQVTATDGSGSDTVTVTLTRT